MPDKLSALHVWTDKSPKTVFHVSHAPPGAFQTPTTRNVKRVSPELFIIPEHAHAMFVRMVKPPSPDKLLALPVRTDKLPVTMSHANHAMSVKSPMPTTRNARLAPQEVFITPETTLATHVRTGKPPPPDKPHVPHVWTDKLPVTMFHVRHATLDKFPTPIGISVKFVPPGLFITP